MDFYSMESGAGFLLRFGKFTTEVNSDGKLLSTC